MIKWLKNRGSLADYVMPYLVIVLTITTILLAVQGNENRHQTDETRALAVETHMLALKVAKFTLANRNVQLHLCQTSGNPTRKAVAALLEKQVEANEKLPHSYFPNIPTKVFHRLVRESIREDHELLSSISPINCKKRYPPPPPNP